MKASLRSVRIAPKKANLIAKMVRGLSVEEALTSLGRTNKKAARLLEQLIESAAANAEHNDKQSRASLIVKSLVVNQAQAYHRGKPIARGRWRAFRKYLSHIDVVLGVAGEIGAVDGEDQKQKKQTNQKKQTKESSQKPKSTVKKTSPKSKKTEGASSKRSSSASSASSKSSDSSS
jgi:large subunit ribosomal protein L22